MQVGTTKKIGSKTYIFMGEGQNLHECVTELSKLSFYDIPSCGLCNGTNLHLDAYIAQGKYKYTIVKCRDCKASLNFGVQTEDPNVSYIRKNSNGDPDWQEFKAKEK